MKEHISLLSLKIVTFVAPAVFSQPYGVDFFQLSCPQRIIDSPVKIVIEYFEVLIAERLIVNRSTYCCSAKIGFDDPAHRSSKKIDFIFRKHFNFSYAYEFKC